MKFIAIVQARLNSTRLPGKVLKPLINKPMLFYTLSRLKKCKSLLQIIVATTHHAHDDPIVHFCKNMDVPTFRGSEENVLERFYQTSLQYPADAYVRITADCPLVDFQLLDQMIEHFMNNPKIDYLSNTLKRSYPKGLDLEIFKANVLKQVYQKATSAYDKEHVTPYIYNHPKEFVLENFLDTNDFSDINLSVDTIEDFLFVQKLIEKLYSINSNFRLNEIKDYLLKTALITLKFPAKF